MVRIFTGVVSIVSILSLATFAYSSDNGHLLIGNGLIRSEVRVLPSFHAVQSDGTFAITITAGKDQNVIIRGDSNILPEIKTEVKNGKLYVYSDHSYSAPKRLDLSIEVPYLDDVNIRATSINESDTCVTVISQHNHSDSSETSIRADKTANPVAANIKGPELGRTPLIQPTIQNATRIVTTTVSENLPNQVPVGIKLSNTTDSTINQPNNQGATNIAAGVENLATQSSSKTQGTNVLDATMNQSNNKGAVNVSSGSGNQGNLGSINIQGANVRGTTVNQSNTKNAAKVPAEVNPASAGMQQGGNVRGATVNKPISQGAADVTMTTGSRATPDSASTVRGAILNKSGSQDTINITTGVGSTANMGSVIVK